MLPKEIKYIFTVNVLYSLICVMWDSPLCTVNVFCYHWFKKKLFGPMTVQNWARQEFQAEIKEKRRQSGRCHVAIEGEKEQVTAEVSCLQL